MIMWEKLNAVAYIRTSAEVRILIGRGGKGQHTAVIQMDPRLLISMAPGRNVEITLDLVPLEAAKDAARVDRIPPPEFRPLGELLLRAPDLPQHVADMHVLLLRLQPPAILLAERLVLADPLGPLEVALLHPQVPARVVLLQQVPREDAVARSVLDVDAQGVAGHVDDDIQIQLELMSDSLLDGEVVLLGAAEPGPEL